MVSKILKNYEEVFKSSNEENNEESIEKCERKKKIKKNKIGENIIKLTIRQIIFKNFFKSLKFLKIVLQKLLGLIF